MNLSGKNVLVTGGCGFIGSNLVRELLKHDCNIAILDNLSTGRKESLPNSDKIKLLIGDIRDKKTVESAMNGIDCVFHLAAQVGNTKSLENPVEDAEINIFGTINVLNAIASKKAKCLVYSSSAATFGNPKYLPIDETHPQNPISPYGASKLSAEKYCVMFSEIHGFDAKCLRYFNVYGVNQFFNPYGNVIPIFSKLLSNGKKPVIFGSGKQTRDFVNVKDVVQANILAAEKKCKSKVFNIGTGKATTLNELAEKLIEVSGKKVSPIYEKPRLGDVEDSFAKISLAKKELKYNPSIKLKDGLKEYFEWNSKMDF